MSLRPVDWNVVIIGRWNPAILTPNGIAKRIFEVEEGKPVGVSVPLDGVSPYRVRSPDEKIIVVTGSERLIITVSKCNYDSLGEAMAAGVKVLKWLPETPVSAAGFNVRFRASEGVPQIIDLVNSGVDSYLSDIPYKIIRRTLGRSVEYNNGELNITITAGDERVEVLFNFHRRSSVHDDLKKWLETPTKNIMLNVNELLDKFSIDIEEDIDGDDRI